MELKVGVPLKAVGDLLLEWASLKAWGEMVVLFEDGEIQQIRVNRVLKKKDIDAGRV